MTWSGSAATDLQMQLVADGPRPDLPLAQARPPKKKGCKRHQAYATSAEPVAHRLHWLGCGPEGDVPKSRDADLLGLLQLPGLTSTRAGSLTR